MFKGTVKSCDGVLACSFVWGMDCEFVPVVYWTTTEVAKLSPIQPAHGSLSLWENLGFSGSFAGNSRFIQFELSLPYWSLFGPSVAICAWLLACNQRRLKSRQKSN